MSRAPANAGRRIQHTDVSGCANGSFHTGVMLTREQTLHSAHASLKSAAIVYPHTVNNTAVLIRSRNDTAPELRSLTNNRRQVICALPLEAWAPYFLTFRYGICL